MPGRDVLARARHRHGRRRPRDPGGEPEVGRARAAAGRSRGPRSALGLEGADLSQVPGRPPRVGRRRARHAGGGDRGDADPPQSAGRARPADRRDLRRRGGLGGRAPRARAARLSILGALALATRERPRHACRPLPVRRVRGAAAADRVGSDRRHGAWRARARGGSQSRTPGRSPTAASSASSSSTAAGAWASSTRRWCTRRARARPSCSERRPGASRRSRAIAFSSRPLPACPAPAVLEGRGSRAPRRAR